MPYGFYISAEGAAIQSKRLDVLANNMANVDTPGFKRDVAVFRARFAEEIQQGNAVPGTGTLNDIGGGVLMQETKTDYSAGPLRTTGNVTDMAIDGDGFFVVRKDNQDYLTRAGNFMRRNNGELVTPDGYQVLDDGGSPIVIEDALGPWQLTPNGSIQQAGNLVPLALVEPKSHGDLVKTGSNLFRPLAPTIPVEVEKRHVLSGFLEQSGVKPTNEMMGLVEASRAFEANINLIRNQDEMLGTLINRVMSVK